MKTASWKMRMATAGMAAVFGMAAVVVVVPGSAGAASSKVVVGKNVPKSALTTRIGITHTSVTIGNVATHTLTLFSGAAVGTQAYADYVNSTGGVNGRKIVVTTQTTGFSSTKDGQLTQAALTKDFALVGSFSIEATSAGQILARTRACPPWRPQ